MQGGCKSENRPHLLDDAAQQAPENGSAMLKTEHEEIRDSVREFVTREVLPIADELDNAEKEIPMPVIGKMAELGYFGLIFSPDYGGMGLDTLSMAIVTEE